MSKAGVVQPNTNTNSQHRQEVVSTLGPDRYIGTMGPQLQNFSYMSQIHPPTNARQQQNNTRPNRPPPQQQPQGQQGHQGHISQPILPQQYQHSISPYTTGSAMSKRMDFDPTQLGGYQQQMGNPYGQPQQQPQQQQQMQPDHLNAGAARKRRLQQPLIPPQQQQNVGSSMPSMMPQPQTLIPGDDASSQPMAQLGAPQQQMQPPPAKKSRTNTPWTAVEEQRLKAMREAGNNWAEIAKTFPSRTEGSVKKHWYKDMHYAEFAEDEVCY